MRRSLGGRGVAAFVFRHPGQAEVAGAQGGIGLDLALESVANHIKADMTRNHLQPKIVQNPGKLAGGHVAQVPGAFNALETDRGDLFQCADKVSVGAFAHGIELKGKFSHGWRPADDLGGKRL